MKHLINIFQSFQVVHWLAGCIATEDGSTGRVNRNKRDQITLWLFNIAMENGPFIDVYLLKMVIFHGYVK
jgi:hypothetical protein